MANSTTHLRTISVGQAQKEVTLNQIVDALSPAATYGRDATACAGLTWGYFGGTIPIDGAPAQVANGTLLLTGSAANYLEADPTDGSVSVNTSGFTPGRTPLYQIAAGTNTVTSYTDLRVLGGASAPVKSVNEQTGDVVLDATDVGADSAGTAAAAVSAHIADSDPHTQYQKESEKGAANGYASLDSGGKLPVAQLPNLAVIDFLGVVADQTAMLALNGQKGDWCARSDNSKVYVITGSDPTQAGSWTALSYPTGTGGTVTSVGLATPGLLFDVTNSPVTGAGTLTMSLKTQAANKFLAGPASGVDAVPTMRALTAADMAAILAAANVFTKNQSVAPVSLGSGVSPAVDASLTNNFKITLGANNTLVNPTNLTEGMILNFAITQDATGGRTLSYGSLYKFPGGTAPTLSTTAGAKDFMSCYYDGSALLCQLSKGFA